MGEDQPEAEYLMRMTATDKYPFDPPRFELFTPNPRYEIGKDRPCLSIGEYHGANYPALLGMIGFAIEIFGTFFMPDKDLGGGISLKIGKGDDKKKKYALGSKAFNEKYYPAVMKLFEEERAINRSKLIDKKESSKDSEASEKSTNSDESYNSSELEESEESEKSEESEEVIVKKVKKSNKLNKSDKTKKTKEPNKIKGTKATGTTKEIKEVKKVSKIKSKSDDLQKTKIKN